MTSEKMQKTLSALFDFQRFAGNARLETLIAEGNGGGGELEDDDLTWVNAAGEIAAQPNRSDNGETNP